MALSTKAKVGIGAAAAVTAALIVRHRKKRSTPKDDLTLRTVPAAYIPPPPRPPPIDVSRGVAPTPPLIPPTVEVSLRDPTTALTCAAGDHEVSTRVALEGAPGGRFLRFCVSEPDVWILDDYGEFVVDDQWGTCPVTAGWVQVYYRLMGAAEAADHGVVEGTAVPADPQDADRYACVKFGYS